MAPIPSTAFVTGGSGFIGGELVKRLAAGGCDVAALARSDRSAAAIEALGARPVRGDLSDVEAMTQGAEGCESAFHLAAHVKQWGDWDDFVEGNVEGTRNALAACRAAGVRRFVHCGTEAAILAGEPVVNGDETLPLRPDSPAPYSATKAQAEQLVRDASAEGFDAVVLRPRFVWGEGDTTLLPEIADATRAGKFAWIAGGTNRTSTTHVDNVVEGLLLAAEKGRPGEAYFVLDDGDVEFREFISALLETQDVEPPDRSIPAPLAGMVARGGEIAWRLLPLKGEPPLTRFSFWVASQECTLDDSKARAELGYVPVISREQGLAALAGAVSG
ncbi:MAG TPA: SDR family NAD(P)-dependent oxidoreductase [Solirubrobacterales bacterium]|nr:SDR family NAD(P)-dependent oxidoreductase [Solirubrobacterales bacterium]